MKFYIKKSSDNNTDTPPCKNAKRVGKDFFNNRIFQIEINTIEELIEIIKEIGYEIIIIPPSESDYNEYEIEIHDDYR